MVTAKYDRINLPVFDAENPLAITRDDIEVAASAGGSSFLRRVFAEPPRKKSEAELSEILDLADKELETIARFCGSRVVKHTWGLYPVPKDLRQKCTKLLLHNQRRLGLPANHILAADVEVVPNPQKIIVLEPVYNELLHGLGRYMQLQRPSEHILRDMNPKQFVIRGSLDAEGSDTLLSRIDTYLVDIEPRFLF